MKTIAISALALTSILAGFPAQASCSYGYDKNSKSFTAVENFANVPGVKWVRGGCDSGYYVVSPGGKALTALHLQNAPYVDSDNVSRNGVGLDAIAFRFGPDGKLENLPVYISQVAPSSFYTVRLQGLSLNRSTLKQVQELFDGHTVRVEKQGDQTVAYLEVPIYNSLASGS